MTKSPKVQAILCRSTHFGRAAVLAACLSTALSDLLAADDQVAPPNDVTNPELLANHLRVHGESPFEFYTSLDVTRRTDLIMALNAADELQDHVAEFMVWEPNSGLRALFWQCLDPADFAAPEQPSSDPEMIALLDLPTVTPIGIEEWVARMEIACRVDPTIGREWVSSAQRAFPASNRIRFAASILILNHGVADGIFTAEEMTAAAQALVGLLSSEQAGSWSAETRIRAYYALYFARDSDAVSTFFHQRQRIEPDPRAREVLGALRTRLLVRMTSPP